MSACGQTLNLGAKIEIKSFLTPKCGLFLRQSKVSDYDGVHERNKNSGSEDSPLGGDFKNATK